MQSGVPQMMKKHMLTIEVAVIIVLILLLCMKFSRKAEQNERLAEGEHSTVEVSADGVITTPDGRVIFAGKNNDNPQLTPSVPANTPTPTLMTEDERRIAALSETDLQRYREATSFSVPENIAFAKVKESLSVRAEAKADAKQIGIMYPDNYCIVESVSGEWAKITTGKVSGYCRVQYLLTGEEAYQYARETAQCTATMTASANIRSGPTTKENNVVGSAAKDKTFKVTKAAVLSDDPDAPLFVEVVNGNSIAYIALGKVKIRYSWTAGKTYP